MPELPEVEVLARSIEKVALNASVQSVKFHRNNLRFELPQKTIKKVLTKKHIQNISRRSKYIMLKTEAGIVTIHLGMTGNVIYSESSKPPAKHTHITFKLKSTSRTFYLHYVDPRRFGYLKAYLTHDVEEIEDFSQLGPEPLTHRKLAEHLYIKSRNKQVPIKSFIMDAKNVVGVGNIYACESLFTAGINPTRKAGSLTVDEFKSLTSSIKKTLKRAIKAGGSSIKDYKDLDRSSGYFALQFSVYGMTNKACKKCKKTINHIKQSGRSTWFCSVCQK